jgi:hypothetical protein
MGLKNFLYIIQEKFFNIFILITYLLIVISFLGLSKKAPIYLETMEFYIRIYVCLFLIWRFNPIRKIDDFTDLDRKIAFSSGLLILTTSALNQYLLLFENKIYNFIHSY